MKSDKDKLSEALARLKREGQSHDVPQEVVDETLRRMADSSRRCLPIRNHRSAIGHLVPLAAAAAILIAVGYLAGRLSTPKPMDLDQIRETLVPSVAAAIEPALRKQVVEDIRRDYQVALAAAYVRVKDELTEQYRDDLNRFAIQTLAASNAATNQILAQLVQDIDTAKTQDLRRIARALSEIEMNRVQDKTQLASGLQTLASRTEDELSRTKWEFAQLLGDVHPASYDVPRVEPRQTRQERNKP
jgi:hypothetical protein